ncbi:hypothetical protein J3Q64DRAFT_1764354 [Phycomyces blakesleeanus]|uniref:Uncharacterized protein n=1 Tax=Phycomyces blakesleeanus TaxID=4837 RepID=A0ABR3APZ6_PHYBL
MASPSTSLDPLIISRQDVFAYKTMIRQLAAQSPQPYGEIPPLLKTKKKKTKKKKTKKSTVQDFSHVENWIAVDSKESLPDEEDLEVFRFSNFLSSDLLSTVLPLHMPPPSLSVADPSPPEEQEVVELELEPEPEQEPEQEPTQEDTGDTSEESDEEYKRSLAGRRSYKSQPSSTLTPDVVLSSSPPQDTHRLKWLHTVEQLKRSLVISTPPLPPPPVPVRPRRRRSEANRQPRFNPDTNTYTRDTRSNPDHLRMISAELNMMRARKLLSPLKPRGFLPRRKDSFISGSGRLVSRLKYDILVD